MPVLRSLGRRRGLVAALAGGALLLSACGGSNSTSGPGSGDSINVGAWTDTTSPSAVTGKAVLAGTQAYFDQINDAGGVNGKKINYTTVNMNYDPNLAVQAARTLIGKDHVAAIVGAFGTAQTEATFPFVLQQSKVPIVGSYAGLSTWYTPPQDYLFGAQALYENQASAAGEWAVEDGHKNIAIVYEDLDSFHTVADAAVKAITAANPSATTKEIAVKLGSTDYSPVLANVQAAKPDAVLLLLTTAEAATYLKERADDHFAAPTYAYGVEADNSLITLAGDAAEGVKTIALTKPPTDDSPAVQQYRDALAKYSPDQQPNFPSLLTYAMAESFVNIVKTIDGPVTSESINEAYQNATNVDTGGILPPLNFSSTSHLGTSEVLRVEVKGGKFVADGDFITPKTTF